MAIKSFEDLHVWQNAIQLSERVYKSFGDLKTYSFKDQIFRASLSISNNIAEGFERESKKEFIRFLFIAKGSCAEVRSMLYLGNKLNFIESNEFTDLLEETKKISSQLLRLIQKIQERM